MEMRTDGIVRRLPEEEWTDPPSRPSRHDHAYEQPSKRDTNTVHYYEVYDSGTRRAKCETHTQLVVALHDVVRDDAVNADGGKHQRERTKARE